MPEVNGRYYDFSSIKLRIKGKEYTGFKSISYNQKLEEGEARGNRAERLGTTLGELKCEGEIEFYREEFDQLTSDYGDGYMEAIFPVIVTYGDDDSKVVTDTLNKCRFVGSDGNPSQGSDALTIKVDLSISSIYFNGVKPLKRM